MHNDRINLISKKPTSETLSHELIWEREREAQNARIKEGNEARVVGGVGKQRWQLHIKPRSRARSTSPCAFSTRISPPRFPMGLTTNPSSQSRTPQLSAVTHQPVWKWKKIGLRYTNLGTSERSWGTTRGNATRRGATTDHGNRTGHTLHHGHTPVTGEAWRRPI